MRDRLILCRQIAGFAELIERRANLLYMKGLGSRWTEDASVDSGRKGGIERKEFVLRRIGVDPDEGSRKYAKCENVSRATKARATVVTWSVLIAIRAGDSLAMRRCGCVALL